MTDRGGFSTASKLLIKIQEIRAMKAQIAELMKNSNSNPNAEANVNAEATSSGIINSTRGRGEVQEEAVAEVKVDKVAEVVVRNHQASKIRIRTR